MEEVVEERKEEILKVPVRKIKTGLPNYETLARVPIEEVVEAMKSGKKFMEIQGHKIKLTSLRIQTYIKGTTCTHCKRKGSFFAAQRFRQQDCGYHFNLYHESKSGALILMTSDHIIPKKEVGNSGGLRNRQVLCQPCNAKKSDKREPE